MKLKTSHLFSLNLYCSLFFIGLGCISLKAFSIESPGIIESLEKLQELQEKNLKKSEQEATTNTDPEFKLSDALSINLEPSFLKSIILQSDTRLLTLVQNDECKFYQMIESGLLKNPNSNNQFLVNIKLKDGTTKKSFISKQDYFANIYSRKCINTKEFNVLFDIINFQKTVLGIKFTIPKGEADCKLIHDEWLANSYTPYLCKINSILKFGKKDKNPDYETYFTKIPLMQRNYIENLCNNLDSPKNFCENYLKSDAWNKVINGELPSFKLNYKCSEFLNLNGQITLKDQQKCADAFNANIKNCETNRKKDFPSYFPLQNCENASLALNNSKLNSDYQDCPGNVDNEAITNINRILNHFYPRKINSTPENCAGEANYSFARLNLDIKYEKGWPLKICYFSKIQNKEECKQYIPGTRDNEPLSEDQVISKILYLQKGAPPKTTCRIVSSKKYNPIRTDYKSGCFVVYNADACTTISCEKKVIWEGKEQSDIKFVGSPTFEYYPSAYANERYATQNLIYESKNIQNRTIRNLTELKFHLDKISNSIIHGIGCAEDLIPEVFIRNALNECHPLPFIIDGHILKNNIPLIIVRTGIDELYSPRLLNWSSIYNSVANYQDLHPLNTWTLNALKK